MAPHIEVVEANSQDKNAKTTSTCSSATIVIHPSETPPYVCCHSKEPFVTPTATITTPTDTTATSPTCTGTDQTTVACHTRPCPSSSSSSSSSSSAAEEINATLNLNLGIPKSVINPDNVLVRKIIRIMHKVFLMWWERYAFAAWTNVPLIVRQKICSWAWKVYLPLHKVLLGRTTGIHPSCSLQYHALTTVMWWTRLFPMTIQRIRMSLSQLSVCHLRDTKVPHSRVDLVSHDLSSPHYDPTKSLAERTVTGYFIQTDPCVPGDKVIFWLYGGAYLGGDAEGNLTPAEKLGRACNCDVFLPDYRLMPETDYDDILWDVVLAYIYLVQIRGVRPKNIVLFGISSGGGLVTRLLQALAEVARDNGEMECESIAKLIREATVRSITPSLMPSGGVLMCPFVDYTVPKGSFEHYDKHDLIVNQSVIEEGIPYLEIKLGSHENRRRTSPVYRSFEGLPLLCVVVSEHECVYDQVIHLVNNARMQGVATTVGCWKYMCHVFCLLSPFVPEGEQSMEFVRDWIIRHQQQSQQQQEQC